MILSLKLIKDAKLSWKSSSRSNLGFHCLYRLLLQNEHGPFSPTCAYLSNLYHYIHKRVKYKLPYFQGGDMDPFRVLLCPSSVFSSHSLSSSYHAFGSLDFFCCNLLRIWGLMNVCTFAAAFFQPDNLWNSIITTYGPMCWLGFRIFSLDKREMEARRISRLKKWVLSRFLMWL